MNLKLISFHVKRFRSLLDINIDLNDVSPLTICGENNIGKTNLLRALNLYFNHIYDDQLFIPSQDIPSHIYFGSQGAGSKVELTGTFENSKGVRESLKVEFLNSGQIKYSYSGKEIEAEFAINYLKDFKYIFIESNNIDLPKLISELLEKDGFLKLDSKRAKQSKPLEKLKEFISLSQKAISDIEKEINVIFKSVTDFDGILSGKEIKINFAEFGKLRDVVKTMTSITLFDGNNHGIALKGSGAQRAVFLTLMQFISKNTKKNIVWGIDEPEAFLQPSLQRRVYDSLKQIVKEKSQPIILTTHSQHFIDLRNVKYTYLFVGQLTEKKYTRKPDQIFYEMNTTFIGGVSDYQKVTMIKKHLGINNNDGWDIMPYNIIVEGEEDKKYLELLIASLKLPIPNIIFSGGASKIAGYLQFYNSFAKDLDYKPEFVCLLDNDNEGREQTLKIRPASLSNIKISIVDLIRFDGVNKLTGKGDWEIEDFIPPNIMFVVINSILKKEKYKLITKKQMSERLSLAHVNKQILKYIEECTSLNNPDKHALVIDHEGRKKIICKKFCEIVDLSELASTLNSEQKRFIQSIVK